MKAFIIVCVLVCASSFFPIHAAGAQALHILPVKAYFTQESIGIGYTLTTANDECRLGIPANSFGNSTDAVVVLRHVPKKRIAETLLNERSLSPLFRYRVKDPAELSSPLWISIAWRKTTEQSYILKEWNEETQTWESIESTIDEEHGRVQGQVSQRTGLVGVFETEKVVVPTTYTGKASWFSGNSIHGYGSAMNIFPIGTRVRVTNTDNGKQTETTIVSTGPFVTGRIIDLSKDAFNIISNTSVGVINVIVEEVKE